MLNPGRIGIEGGEGEEKLTLLGQARWECESEEEYKKKKKADDLKVHQPLYISVFYPRMDYLLSISSDTRTTFYPFILFLFVLAAV